MNESDSVDPPEAGPGTANRPADRSGDAPLLGNGHEVGNSRATGRERMSLLTALAIVVWAVLADWLIYRTEGYSGPAVFFGIAPLFFVRRSINGDHQVRSPAIRIAKLFCFVLLICAAIRLAFVGSPYVVFSAILLVFATALASSNAFPWAMETLAMSARSFVDGFVWLAKHRMPNLGLRSGLAQPGAGDSPSGNSGAEHRGIGILAWLLPALAIVVFGGIFVLANPDLQTMVSERFNLVSTWAWQWVGRLDGLEIPFCVSAMILGAGLFHPFFGKRLLGGIDTPLATDGPTASPMYAAFRNTLVCLILLFSVYLVFEFTTLFKREFPDGFYYAGYAHQGAAWLTAALALATGLLSLVFRASTLQDPRIGRLKSLAWVWSGTNLLLAMAVYNRLAIYVGYNGLTVMRIVGFFGISVVVVGFTLVLAKIRLEKGFWWLLRTQLTALLLFIVAFTLFPVDYVAHRFNASRINRGYLPPSVMIAVKFKDESGYLPMLDLVDCPDPTIREGVLAMLAEKQIEIKRSIESHPWHWTRFQGSTELLYPAMVEQEHRWQEYVEDEQLRLDAIDRFVIYAMKWY